MATIVELNQALPVLLKHKITPFIWGAQGIGKTQTIKQYAKKHGLGFVHLHLATQEVGDLVGLLLNAEKDGTAFHTRPSWFPTEGKGIIFLDELNRATPDVLNAVFSLIVGGTIHTHKLPEGWSLVAAGNYQTNAFNVTDTSDAAFMSRFCHIDLKPSVEEFVSFVEDKSASSIASFISTHREMLEVEHKEGFNFQSITPDRRAWADMIAPLEEEESIESIRMVLYSGIVGKTAAASFLTHKKKASERLSGREILNNFTSNRELQNKINNLSDPKNTRFDLLNTAVDEILLFVTKKDLNESQMTNLKEFMIAIPLELGNVLSRKISDSSWSQKNQILNDVEFVKKFTKLKLRGKSEKT
jgi:hypothetical protein